MKKRIICLILTVVMLALSLVGCGYNYTKDDLSQYATFNKEAFDKALLALEIEDGDFTTSPETRAKRVVDAIYAELKSVSGSTPNTEGVIGVHDVLRYCYYITYVDADGNTVQLAPDYMKTGKAVELQLGNQFPTDLQAAILAKIAGYDFTDKSFSNVTSGKAEAGQVAFITYTYSYDETVDGKVTTKSDTVTLECVTLDLNDPLHKPLISVMTEPEEGSDDEPELKGLSIGSTASDFDIEGGYKIAGKQVDAKIKISKAKIEFVAKGPAFEAIKDKTYDADSKTELKDIYGNTVKVADKELTYYVYPVNYLKVEDFDAVNVLNLVYGGELTFANVKDMLFGVDFSKKSEDEQKTLLDGYKYKVGDKELSLEDFVTSLVKALSDYESAKDTLEDAETDLEKAESDRDTKKIAAEKSDATDEDKQEYEKAKEAVATYTKSVETAKTELEKATAARDEKVFTFLTKDEAYAKDYVKKLADAEKAYDAAVKAEEDAKAKAEAEGATDDVKAAYETAKTATATAKTAVDTLKAELATKAEAMSKAITDGYSNITYDTLQKNYRSEIKTALAKEINELIKKHVTVNSVPEKAVEEAFDQMMENYQHSFYENEKLDSDTSSSTSSSETFYKKYDGSFKNFLINYAVPTDIGTKVTTYDEAIAAMEKQAEEYVKPVLQIYVVANAFGLTFTDKEFDEYKENNSSYTYNETLYGENTVRNAAQFDKILNHFLTSEEKGDGKEGAESDKRFKTDNYTLIKYTFKAED